MNSVRLLKTLTPWILYGLMAFFILWLFFVSNVFTMGYYTPMFTRIALSVVALVLPLAAVSRRTKSAMIIASMFALLTWVPIIMLWIMEREGDVLKSYR